MRKERLDILLVKLGLTSTRQRAQAEIMAGNVLVNDTPATKASMVVPEDAPIRLKDTFPYVSRGALKLLHALDHYRVDVTGLVAADIGSSTGGFTEVLLERGASRVYAVDSGTNQLDWKLRNDPRVTVMENTNARHLDPAAFDPAPDIATVDVSFISVSKILPSLVPVLKPEARVIVLIKPQFELSPDKIGDRGLAPLEHHQTAIRNVLSAAEETGLEQSEVIESPVTGAKSGNTEYLVLFKKSRQPGKTE